MLRQEVMSQTAGKRNYSKGQCLGLARNVQNRETTQQNPEHQRTGQETRGSNPEKDLRRQNRDRIRPIVLPRRNVRHE